MGVERESERGEDENSKILVKEFDGSWIELDGSRKRSEREDEDENSRILEKDLDGSWIELRFLEF